MKYIKCADCDHRYCEFCIAGDKYQKKAKSNAVTNFDRIKAMSVEEMAEFIFLNFQTDRFGNPIVDNEVMPYKSNVIGWLESEVQEDEM